MRRALVGFGLLCLAAWLAVWLWARLPSAAPLTAGEREAVMAQLRAALDGATGAVSPLPERSLAGPLFVTLYLDGTPALRWQSSAATLPAAVAALRARMARVTPSAAARMRGRLLVDVTLARAPILAWPRWLFALAIVPGVDGIGVTTAGRTAWLGADDLLREEVLAKSRPLPALEFQLGADSARIEQLLAQKLELSPAAFARAPKHWFRFVGDRFVEPAGPADRGRALPVVRGHTPGPRLSKRALFAGAVAGGKYLLRHLYDDGRFGYEYVPSRDQDLTYVLEYSLPRHAGATYFLAQLYGATHEPSFAKGAAQALEFLKRHQAGACGRPDRGCISTPEGRADLGTAAMTLLAISEYERVTGDRALLPWARRLANFLLFMQKDDGDFCHQFDPGADRRDTETQLLYFSGEANFALAQLLALGGLAAGDEARYRAALVRGLDFLTRTQYAHLAGQFYFGEDHWTCMAADAGWEALSADDRARYATFCDQFVAFSRRSQFTSRDAIAARNPDFAGAYGLSPLLPPHATPVGSRSEAALSTYAMQRRRGLAKEAAATRAQLALGMQFLLDHQIDDDNAYLMANPDAARGGFLMSDVERYVRIDFVQHACSAMLRAAAIW